jgi:hypothetical protein
MPIKWRAVHGGTRVFGDGYYSTSLLEPDGRTIPASRRRYEPSVGIEITPTHDKGWRPYLSVDARLRNIYDYHRASPDVPEDRQWSVGGVIGLRNGQTRPNERGVPDLILRGYWGVNHTGFRSQRRTGRSVGLRSGEERDNGGDLLRAQSRRRARRPGDWSSRLEKTAAWLRPGRRRSRRRRY